jgi:hypothetical protein
VDEYERLRGGQSVALYSGVTTLAFYCKLGFCLEMPQERFQAASKPYLYERQLPKALDSIARCTREPGPPAAVQRRRLPPTDSRRPRAGAKLHEEVEEHDVWYCLESVEE